MLREPGLNKISIYIMGHLWELYEDNNPFLDCLTFQTVFFAFSERSLPKTVVWISKKAKKVVRTEMRKEISLILFRFIVISP